MPLPDTGECSTIVEQGRAILSDAHARLQEGDVTCMDTFVTNINQFRQKLPLDDWHEFIQQIVAKHPLRPLIHEDPFTRRAFEKPRGYAGDAPLLDLIYRDAPYAGALSELGADLHAWTESQPACRSVQERRNILSSLIDSIAREKRNPRIASIACGHLREAQRSAAVLSGDIDEFVALDQDAESLAVVGLEQQHLKVTPIRASIRRLIVAPTRFGSFDLIYTAGLCDYLDIATAKALVVAMFTALRPGGVMLLANFAPQLRDIGYMEAIMDWRLLYRDEESMSELASVLPCNEVTDRIQFRDSANNVVYLTVRKAD